MPYPAYTLSNTPLRYWLAVRLTNKRKKRKTKKIAARIATLESMAETLSWILVFTSSDFALVNPEILPASSGAFR